MKTPYLFFFFLVIFSLSFVQAKLSHSLLFSSNEGVEKHEQLVSIYIPSIQLYLPLVVAPIRDEEWQIGEEKTAFFGEGSARPGTKGTSVVFAHARLGLFANLPEVLENDQIFVFSNNRMYQYSVTKQEIVTPEATEFIKTNGKNDLVLFTCIGKNDTHRILFFSKLIKKGAIPSLGDTLYQI